MLFQQARTEPIEFSHHKDILCGFGSDVDFLLPRSMKLPQPLRNSWILRFDPDPERPGETRKTFPKLSLAARQGK
jgi:hypothetical protein